jgi:hypothetical protein
MSGLELRLDSIVSRTTEAGSLKKWVEAWLQVRAKLGRSVIETVFLFLGQTS